MMSNICCTSSGDRPSEGSSNTSSLGSAIMPRAIATICCSPPDSEPAYWASRSRTREDLQHLFELALHDGTRGALYEPISRLS